MYIHIFWFISFLPPSSEVACCSVTQLCMTLCNPADCSKPGFPVLHYLLEFAQTQVHWVDDAIQPAHPLLSPSPPALNLAQHQGPDNHDGVITHLEPDILECEVKWALGSITMNKANEGDGIPVELFQILKKWCCESAALNMPEIWKTQQWP